MHGTRNIIVWLVLLGSMVWWFVRSEPPQIPYNRGIVLAKEGKHDEAIEAFTRAIERKPPQRLLAAAYSDRGVVHDRLNHPAEALADYNRAIEIDPTYWAPFCNRGGLFMLQGKLDAAMVDLDRAVELNPSSAGVLATRGTARANAGRVEEARADFETAAKLDPEVAAAIQADMRRQIELREKAEREGRQVAQ